MRKLKNEITRLNEVNEKLLFDIRQLTDKIDSFPNSGSKDRVCAHCGSNRLKRTGSKPNERFRKVGIKDALFLCGDCGKETAVMIIIPSK